MGSVRLALALALVLSACGADAGDETVVLGAFSQRGGFTLPCGPSCVDEHCEPATVPPVAEATMADFGVVEREPRFDRYCTFEIEPMRLDAETAGADWLRSDRGAYLVRGESALRCDPEDLGSALLLPEVGLDQEVIETDDGVSYEITVEAGIIGDPSGCFEEFGTWATGDGRLGIYRQTWDGVRLGVELGPNREPDRIGLLDNEAR